MQLLFNFSTRGVPQQITFAKFWKRTKKKLTIHKNFS